MHMHSLLARLLPLGALILACATLPSAAEDLSTEDPAAALEKPAADHATIVHDLDTDGDGKISKSELVKRLKVVHNKMEAAALAVPEPVDPVQVTALMASEKETFDELDANADGELSFKEKIEHIAPEHREAVPGERPAEAESRDELDEAMRANERTHFDATDLDKSGGLSLKEYVTGLLHVPLAAEHEGAAEKVVHEQVEDADKNGLVSRHEYLEFHAYPTAGTSEEDWDEVEREEHTRLTKEHVASTGERFDEADANSDGQLSVEEYGGLFAPSAQSDAPDFHADASGTMEFADKDKDGFLSAQEVQDDHSVGWLTHPPHVEF